DEEYVTSWERRFSYRPGKWAQTDYNFETPNTSLMAREDSVLVLPRNKAFEVYDYPGEYESVAEGRRLTRIRMEEEETEYDVVHGESTCIPGSVPFRPARTTKRPTVQGPQTAVVVGPAGEEIYTDRHGRVKVQFHLDREGKRDENNSCWMRVPQSHAG